MQKPTNPYDAITQADDFIQWALGQLYRELHHDSPEHQLQNETAIDPAWLGGYLAQKRAETQLIELPCPPYEYERTENEGTLTITADGYTKTGRKAEWQAFLDEAQSKVNEMPREIDLSDTTNIEVTVQAQANAQWTVEIDVATLLYYNEKFDDVEERWYGTKAELAAAIQKGLENLDNDQTTPVFNDVSWDEFGERNVDIDDVDYDLSEIADDKEGA
ncbi:MAG: hypothetical protein DRH08_00610 [Deltaproteobacteria bacterium]|nr:MAG: hypothetical protein DRH08_00610 [Deltaproteobacteria bacterium]